MMDLRWLTTTQLPSLKLFNLMARRRVAREVEIEGMGELAENITWRQSGVFRPMYTSIDTPNLSGIGIVEPRPIGQVVVICLASWLSLDYVVSKTSAFSY
ncbi:MAG: hypothetical protein R3C68_07250 [Myxococcota bacterium]